MWSLYAELSLSRVAAVLLSVSASEASVERSFSAQAAVHSDERNRLHGETVEAEMFLKFNHRAMQPRKPEDRSTGVVEMDDDFDAELHPSLAPTLFSMPADIDEVASTDDEQPATEVDAGAMDIETWEDEFAAPSDAAASSGAARRRARRKPSIVHSSLAQFVEWFIAEFNITVATPWNVDLRNALTRYSSRIPPPIPNAKSIEDAVRAAAQRLADNH